MVVKLLQLHGYIWIDQSAIVAVGSPDINKCRKVYLVGGHEVPIKDTPENLAAMWDGAMMAAH